MRTAQGRYQCVVFDLDGTLLDTRAGMLAAINVVLDTISRRPVRAHEVQASMHHGLSAMLLQALEITGGALDSDVQQQLHRRLVSEYLIASVHSVSPYPELFQLLRALRKREVWMAVCTNQAETIARELLESFELTSYFNEVVGRDTFSFHKPHPMPLIWLMGRGRARQDGTLMVGDSEVDAQCAQRAGVHVILMGHGYGLPEGDHIHDITRDFASLYDRLCAD